MKLSIIIPCYNEIKTIEKTLKLVLDSPIELDFGVPRRHRMVVPDREWEDGLMRPTDPPQRIY